MMIHCCNLFFTRKNREVLKAINFDLDEGEILGLIGHNGAGKSTLIKLVLGLLMPTSGELRVLNDVPGKQRLQIGYVPENVSFYDAMTVREHMDYFARLKGVQQERIQELLGSLNLRSVAAQKVGNCSKGQRQRLGLAQALLSQPKLLLLDEPTVGLDPDASAFMYQELSDLRKKGCGVVVCTHELSLIEPYLDKALLIGNGMVKGSGSLDELREQAGLTVDIVLATIPSGLQTDERLAPYCQGRKIQVPESLLPSIVRLLTKDYGCFDFEVHKANLRTIYQALIRPKDSVLSQEKKL